MSVIECGRCDGTGAEPDDSPDERTYPCQGCAGTGEAVTAAEHTLVRDGEACDPAGLPYRAYGIYTRAGRAACSCGWVSAVRYDDQARRYGHAQHVTEETL